MPLETIEHRRLYRQVADQLRSLIKEGELTPGTRLPPERELAERLGISRPTVREALIALEVEGKVRIRVGSGVYVAETPSVAPIQAVLAEGPFEVLQARQLIETAIAGEAAQKASPDDLAELRTILERMAHADQPSAEAMHLDREFHVTIAGILGNGLLARVVGELFDQRVNPYFSQLASHFENSKSWEAAVAEHRLVHERIAARDAPGAARAMRAHLQASQDRFSQSFSGGSRPHGASTKRKHGGTGRRDNPSQEKLREERR
jgi:DNA-binding FadR family transcriptional regulator